jgi:hypothetical protein
MSVPFLTALAIIILACDASSTPVLRQSKAKQNKALPASTCKNKAVGDSCTWSKVVAGRGLFDEDGQGSCKSIQVAKDKSTICCSAEPWCTKRKAVKKAIQSKVVDGNPSGKESAQSQIKSSRQGLRAGQAYLKVERLGKTRGHPQRSRMQRIRSGRQMSQKVKRKPVFLLKDGKKKLKRRDMAGRNPRKANPSMLASKTI